jgi:hypothetical protein
VKDEARAFRQGSQAAIYLFEVEYTTAVKGGAKVSIVHGGSATDDWHRVATRLARMSHFLNVADAIEFIRLKPYPLWSSPEGKRGDATWPRRTFVEF